MGRIVTSITAALILAPVLVPSTATPSSAYCLFDPSYKWPTTGVGATGYVSWNSTTRSYINAAVQKWTAVTPSPLTYGDVAWLSSSVPSQVQGLVLSQGRFSGDYDAPGYASGSLTANHTKVNVIFSNYSSRWSWSNTAHGPFKSSGLVTTHISTVAIHEVGHAAGLAHPYSCTGEYTDSEKAGVMTAQWDAIRTSLGSDDASGLNAKGY